MKKLLILWDKIIHIYPPMKLRWLHINYVQPTSSLHNAWCVILAMKWVQLFQKGDISNSNSHPKLEISTYEIFVSCLVRSVVHDSLRDQDKPNLQDHQIRPVKFTLLFHKKICAIQKTKGNWLPLRKTIEASVTLL